VKCPVAAINSRHAPRPAPARTHAARSLARRDRRIRIEPVEQRHAGGVFARHDLLRAEPVEHYLVDHQKTEWATLLEKLLPI
jgi:hypothetical protein